VSPIPSSESRFLILLFPVSFITITREVGVGKVIVYGGCDDLVEVVVFLLFFVPVTSVVYLGS
jgi:hypothetical protein